MAVGLTLLIVQCAGFDEHGMCGVPHGGGVITICHAMGHIRTSLRRVLPKAVQQLDMAHDVVLPY
jgi:hypothetical protein